MGQDEPVTSADKPTRRLVEQRVRNRIIEYLELASSFEQQVDYQRNVPIANVPAEMVEQWADQVHGDPRASEQADVYSAAEVKALGDFSAVWRDVVERTPNPLPAIEEMIGLPVWEELRVAAASALASFQKRGTMPEDVEV